MDSMGVKAADMLTQSREHGTRRRSPSGERCGVQHRRAHAAPLTKPIARVTIWDRHLVAFLLPHAQIVARSAGGA